MSKRSKKIIHTHVKLPNEAGDVVVLEEQRQNLPRKPCLVIDVETGTALKQ